MKFFAKICKAVARDTIHKDIQVLYVTTKETQELADYGGNTLRWNVRNMGGKKVFQENMSVQQWAFNLGILIHELSHDKYGCNNGFAHHSHEYQNELERIAGICFQKGIDYYVQQCSE